ncbi:hypothetical protein BS78_01G508500 [Paspalum vaginatum]|nr:hypothetical protein BS78_01G508500 [Paspalum vaginatum]
MMAFTECVNGADPSPKFQYHYPRYLYSAGFPSLPASSEGSVFNYCFLLSGPSTPTCLHVVLQAYSRGGTATALVEGEMQR